MIMSKAEETPLGPEKNDRKPTGAAALVPGASVDDILSALTSSLSDRELEKVTRGLQSQAQARRDAKPPILVESAIDLPLDLQTAIAARVKQVFHLENPTLVFQVDPGHMGGLKLTVGDDVFDGTVRTRLKNFERQLRGQNI